MLVSMPPSDPFIGRAILEGKYQIISRVEEGVLGTIYRAHENDLNRAVAIKVLNPALQARRDLTSRFRREARAMSQLSHPNVVRVFGAGVLEAKDGGPAPYLVMEPLDGRTLQAAIVAQGALTQQRAALFAKQLCGALQEVHQFGIVHRNVTPQNVFLCQRPGKEDVPKLMEFGLSKVTEQQLGKGSAFLTRSGEVFGTLDYMSPEQAMGSNVDERSDLYSLGVVLYQMLCGELPYEAKTGMDLVSLQPVPLGDRGVAVAEGLRQVLAKVLAKQPAERFASAEEFAQALDALEFPTPTNRPQRSSTPVILPGAALDEDDGAVAVRSGEGSPRTPVSADESDQSVPVAAPSPSPSTQDESPAATRVFISYSHDDAEHAGRVWELAMALRARGLVVSVDQDLSELGPDEGWPAWTHRQLSECEHVIMVGSPIYRRRVERTEAPGTGYGATFEGHLLMQLVYSAGTRRSKLVPVLFGSGPADTHLPLFAQGFHCFQLPQDLDTLARALGRRSSPDPSE